jgi:hypothetical protein
MAKGDQINLKPHFRDEGPTLPCEGEVGDLFVFSPLNEGEQDTEPTGRPSLWFCIKRAEGDGRNALWVRVHFDGKWTCAAPPPNPPVYPDVPRPG